MRKTDRTMRGEEPPWWQRPLGRRWPIMWRLAIDLLDDGLNFVETMDREMRAAEVERCRKKCRQRAEEERAVKCDLAVSYGEALTELKRAEGERGWARDVRTWGTHPEAARRKVALYTFAKMWPTLYARLRVLGPERLSKAVEELDEALAKMTEERTDGSKRVKNLTDDELMECVRSLTARRKKAPMEGARAAAETMAGRVQKLTRSDVRPGSEDAQTLNSLLEAACKHLATLSVA